MEKLVEENITGDILQHMYHTEDLVLEGSKATQYMYNTLIDVFNALKGNTTNSHVTVKLDGAPNVTAASNYHGRAFVGTKYSFKPKTSILREDRIAYTEEEISKVSDNPVVQQKLKLLLKALPYINIPKDEIWAGDYLFSNTDLKQINIEGEEYLSFQPNTIVYAVPVNDLIAKMMRRSVFGVAWHTKYTGPDYEHLHVGFDVTMNQINEVPNVFQMDASLPSIAGKVTMTAAETSDVQTMLKSIKSNIDKITNESWYSQLIENRKYVDWLNNYRNVVIRTNTQDVRAEGFKEWLSNKLDKAAEGLKTEAGKAKAKAKNEEYLNFLSNEQLDELYNLQNQIRIVKEFFVKKLDSIATMKTFLNHVEKGYFPANAEGYAVSDIDGNVQKIVSRLEFSQSNFSKDIIKGWTSEARDREMISESLIKKFKENLEPQILEDVRKLTATDIIELLDKKSKTEVVTDPARSIQSIKDGIDSETGMYADFKIYLRSRDPSINRQQIAENYRSYLINTFSEIEVGTITIIGSTSDAAPVFTCKHNNQTYLFRFKPSSNASRSNLTLNTSEQENCWAYLISKEYAGTFTINADELKSILMRKFPEFGFDWWGRYWWLTFTTVIPKIREYFNRPVTVYWMGSGTKFISYPKTTVNIAEKIDNLFKKTHCGKQTLWTPSDIYVCSDENAVNNLLENYEGVTIKDLNALLSLMLKNKVLAGVSLKCIRSSETNGNIEEFNVGDMSYDIDLELLNARIKGQDVSKTCVYAIKANNQNYNLNFRTSEAGISCLKFNIEINGHQESWVSYDQYSQFAPEFFKEVNFKNMKTQDVLTEEQTKIFLRSILDSDVNIIGRDLLQNWYTTDYLNQLRIVNRRAFIVCQQTIAMLYLICASKLDDRAAFLKLIVNSVTRKNFSSKNITSNYAPYLKYIG